MQSASQKNDPSYTNCFKEHIYKNELKKVKMTNPQIKNIRKGKIVKFTDFFYYKVIRIFKI